MEPQQRMLGRGGRGVGGEELARQAFGLLSALREACPELRPWPFQRRDRRLLGPPYDASGPAFEENAPAAAARPAFELDADLFPLIEWDAACEPNEIVDHRGVAMSPMADDLARDVATFAGGGHGEAGEEAQLAVLFAALDSDGAGALSREQVSAFSAAKGGDELTEAAWREIHRALGGDGAAPGPIRLEAFALLYRMTAALRYTFAVPDATSPRVRSPSDPGVVALREHLRENNGVKGLEMVEPHEVEKAAWIFRRDGVSRTLALPRPLRSLTDRALRSSW